MKEVKEVVHVPTRELAEEVLRVAKENGFNTIPLDRDIEGNHYGANLCLELKMNPSISLFCDNKFFEKEGYKIITVKEFLDRYKESELNKLRKENEELKKHYTNVEHELKQLNNELSKELGLVKQQLKAIEDQPKIGDVCLYWQNCSDMYELGMFSEDIKSLYDNCIKATDENIKLKIKELKNE